MPIQVSALGKQPSLDVSPSALKGADELVWLIPPEQPAVTARALEQPHLCYPSVSNPLYIVGDVMGTEACLLRAGH